LYTKTHISLSRKFRVKLI